MKCFSCQASLDIFSNGVSRNDSCPKCGRDVRACKNCIHFSPSSQWSCREHLTEQVLEKEKSNFCDFFKLGENAAINEAVNAANLKNAAEALFRKK